MRTFEVVLVLASLLSLCLSFERHSKAVWLAAAGANLFMLLIHALFEGLRYQMAFSYAFVILLALYALAKTSGGFSKARLPRTPKVTAVGLSFVLLASTSLLAYALPVVALPKRTGSYDVGIKYFDLVDEARNEPFLAQSAKKRELMVQVYYPAEKNDSKPFSRYFHGSPQLIRSYVGSNGIPGFLFDHLALVKTDSKEGLPLSDQQQSYPVVLFSHGAGTTIEVQTSQCEDLASHGYIVAAIDHTYVSAATLFPDRIVLASDATAALNAADPAWAMSQIMADDSEFVIEKLGEMNKGKIDPAFKGKLNLDETGAIGHSLGGSVAYNLAINDSRIKAAIDLDGDVYVTPKDGSSMVPFLMLASDDNIQMIENREPLMMRRLQDMPHAERERSLSLYGGSEEAYDEAYQKASQNVAGLADTLEASGNLFTIVGSST